MEKSITATLDEYAPLKTTTKRQRLPPKMNENIDFRNKLKCEGVVITAAFVPLTNFIFYTDYFPKRWKTRAYIFLHKASKDHGQVLSYRSNTLLDIMGKLCKQLILKRLTATVERLQSPFRRFNTVSRGPETQRPRSFAQENNYR
ncbi:RNA-directed DNA polymerase from mobile element jockey [Eumeta japonica]|uniref:RNA-directed DNA polymerase from mobile element jockey n=1 Tax=Eumeta variegata TaxID=151549 RepID=A0A4C1UXP2_EUMVA|nr:RNA-directed DNA polymerase from mobile element jockey [Eumeta japonica]